MASRPTRQHIDVARMIVKCETMKVGYETRAEALDGAESGMDAGKVDPGCHLTPYACELCGEWHVRNRRIVFLDPANVAKGRLGRRHDRGLP